MGITFLHLTPKDQLKYHLAAEVGDHEHNEAAECPADRRATTPAETPSPPQEGGKEYPGGAGEHRLVDQVLREDVFKKEEARHQGQGQQREARINELKEEGLHGLQRWQCADDPLWMAVVQLAILNGQDKRLDKCQGEQCIGEKGEDDVDFN